MYNHYNICNIQIKHMQHQNETPETSGTHPCNMLLKNSWNIHYKNPANPWWNVFVTDQQKTSPNKICDNSLHHGLSVMDWPPWRFVKNHHGLTKTVTILNHHGRARGLVSPAQVHFLWRKINVTDELPRYYEGLHGWWRGHYLSPSINGPKSKMGQFLAQFQLFS
jgi:hypothetical protein